MLWTLVNLQAFSLWTATRGMVKRSFGVLTYLWMTLDLSSMVQCLMSRTVMLLKHLRQTAALSDGMDTKQFLWTTRLTEHELQLDSIQTASFEEAPICRLWCCLGDPDSISKHYIQSFNCHSLWSDSSTIHLLGWWWINTNHIKWKLCTSVCWPRKL